MSEAQKADLHDSDCELHNPPAYPATQCTCGAGSSLVHVEHGRVWIKVGNRSFMLAYEPDNDEDAAWYAKQLADTISSFTPDVKTQQAQAPIDPDGAESRAGFRAFDESQMARWATPWQVWREAVKWAARPAQQAQAPKVTVCDLVQVDGFGKYSRSQHDADSAELRSLCKARDEARRERDMLRAELAGHEASGGHLSALVDDLRGLLSEAMRVMKALHESASPDDGPEMNAIVPAGAFHEFVDANAALMHKIHISPHGDGSAAPQQGSKS